MTITLITTQKELDKLIQETNWHSAFIKETHFANSERRSAENDGTICGLATLVRILIALPDESYALEIAAFDTEACRFLPKHMLEESKSGIIKRRRAELDFSAFYLQAACVGYRQTDVTSVQSFNYYSTEELFDQDGELLHPYSVNWRVALDDSFSRP